MNDFFPLGGPADVLADDLLLDRIAGRGEAGGEPVASLLVALAAHADSPLPARTGRRRVANKHRYLSALAVLAVAASGAGVAAAVTLPREGSLLADRARIEQRMEQSSRNGAPSALLSRLGLPATDGTTAASGLVLARGANGTFVLLPAAVAAARAGSVAAGATTATGDAVPSTPSGAGAGPVGATDPGTGVVPPSAGGPAAPGAGKAPKNKPAKPGKVRPGTGATAGNGQRNGQVGNGQGANGQGANGQAADGATGQTGSDPIWVVDPATSSTTDPASPAGTTVAGPATTDNRLVDPSTQQSLVGPSTSPKTNRRDVVPGVGPSVTPGAARLSRPSSPQATNTPGAARSAVAAAKQAAAAAAAPAQAAGSSAGGAPTDLPAHRPAGVPAAATPWPGFPVAPVVPTP